MKRKKIIYILILILLVLFSFTFRFIPFIESDIRPYIWDSLSIINGSEAYIETGSLQPDIIQHSGYSPTEFSKRGPYYPLIQIGLAFIRSNLTKFGFSIQTYELVVFISLFLNILLILSSFFIFKEITENTNLSIIGVFFISICLTITRDIIWCTIPSLLGYLIAFLIILGVIKYIKSKSIVWIVISILLFVSLSLIHLLTFSILLLSLVLFLILNNFKDLKFSRIILIFCILIIGSTIFISVYPEDTNLSFIDSFIFILYLGSSYFMQDSIVQNLQAPWNIPIFIGYVPFILGILGLVSIRIKKIKLLLFSILFVAIVMGSTYLIGFNYFGERIILYSWIPLYLSIPMGIKTFSHHLKVNNKLKFSSIIIGLLLISSTLNAIVYQKNFYLTHYSSIPSNNDIDAINWLIVNSQEEDVILTISYWPYVSTKWIPVLTRKRTAFLNMDSINRHDSYSLSIVNPKGFIGVIAEKLANQQTKTRYEEWLVHRFKVGYGMMGYETYLMFKFPDCLESKELINSYSIKYVYTYFNTPEDQAISESSNYILVFSNERVRIYERNIK